MRDTRKSLIWITELLKQLNIPFQIAGGLAAHAYGATRPIHDIDIDIPENCFELLLPYVKDYVIYGPAFYHDEHWKLFLMTLNHDNQYIDLGGAHQDQIFNSETQTWQSLNTDFSKSVSTVVLDLVLPIISREELISYKKALNRPVDCEDIRQITAR